MAVHTKIETEDVNNLFLDPKNPRPWPAAVTQPWFLLRSLSWSERASWLTWVVIILLYRAMPRREGQGAGLGILARSLGRRSRRTTVPNETPT